MNLPEKLTYLRKQKGLTQSNLAETLNVSRQAISRWEVGSAVPSTDNLKVLSELYGVSVDYLLNDNADDSSINTENQEQEPKKQEEGAHSKKYRYILVCVATLIMAIVIIIYIMITQVQRQELEQATPIGEMDSVIEDNYTVYGFSIG
ncbi:MAG: helix-turn-helix domain-containing protein [Faecousia sp.]